MRIKLQVPMSLDEIQKITYGFLNSPDATITHIVTDSREVKRGDLFIALRGERFDGDDYVEEIIRLGGYVLSEKSDFATVTVKQS